MTKTLSLSLFSRYRSELMGIAMIGVLIAHFVGLGEVTTQNIFIKVIRAIPRVAFTEGFLFLSGFGLYYSFAKNCNLKDFYLRRFKRLLIPFVILSAGYYIFHDFIENFDPVKFFMHLSSLAFWVDGNYNGMWYIAMSVLLYALFPLVYKFILTNGGGKILILVLVAIILIHLLQYIWPEYYTKISIGINKIPIFLLGVYAGQISIRQREKEGIVLLITVIMVWIASFF